MSTQRGLYAARWLFILEGAILAELARWHHSIGQGSFIVIAEADCAVACLLLAVALEWFLRRVPAVVFLVVAVSAALLTRSTVMTLVAHDVPRYLASSLGLLGCFSFYKRARKLRKQLHGAEAGSRPA